MYSFSTYKDQYKSNLKLALPVVLTQLGQILTQVADNLMVGYFYSRERYRGYLDGFSPRNYSWSTVKKLLHMGLPISM